MTALSLLTLLGRVFDPLAALLQIGLGGYVVGRSVEKVAPQITASLDQKRGFIR